MASDDSLNDYSFDDHDSSSSEICRVDHCPCLVSLLTLTLHEHDMPKTVSQTLLSFCLTCDIVQMTHGPGTHGCHRLYVVLYEALLDGLNKAWHGIFVC